MTFSFFRSARDLAAAVALCLLLSICLSVSQGYAEEADSNLQQPEVQGLLSTQEETQQAVLATQQGATEQGSQQANSDHSASGVWQRTTAGWKYLVDGTPSFGFVIDDGKTYYLDEKTGIMRTGWQKIKGDWFLFGSSGAMRTGWVKSGSWYYLDPSQQGKMLVGRHVIDKATYYLGSTGAMRTGWVKDGSDWYFFGSSGAMRTGWVKDGSWYYLDPSQQGKMAVGRHVIDKATYYLGSTGAMRTGWVKDGSDWYCFAASGAMRTGWVKDGSWYYLDPSQQGKMRTGRFQDQADGAWYVSSTSGAMYSNRWVKQPEGWYYATNLGSLKSGWQKSGGKWYWLQGDKQGLMIANATKTISGDLYSFDGDGAMRSNCQIRLENDKCGYASASGAISMIGTFSGDKVILQDAKGNTLNGWNKLAGKWFYADKDGVMQTGWFKENGKWYWLADDGAMATSTWVDGGRYYVGSDGVWVQATIIRDIRGQFAHGVKTAQYQKYIVIHDTEGGGTPQNVISGWASNGQRVASHFVIGKDGTVIQCVELDKIAHHVGFAPRGSNAKFGVYEDGRDDRVGTISIGSYSPDYGMNSYSIGIELVHQGSTREGYPVAQLKALDMVIAYIDAHYGFQSTIIDHKMWNGNSDTSKEFAGYLANYRDHRTYN